jgi:hypothetical protein
MSTKDSTSDDLFSRAVVESYVKKNPRFVRRDWLAAELDKLLNKPSCRFALLTAKPGAGKSTFIAQLAHDHPRRPVYFIRRDQRSVLRDASATSFLLHTGFQLATLYPELFVPERIKVAVEQEVGEVAATGEMVGIKVKRMLASPFYQKVFEVKQRVRQIRGRVTGFQIREYVVDPRLLSLSDLQEMALIYPARALLEMHPAERIIILIDALDEIRYQANALGREAALGAGHQAEQRTLLDWLTSAPELPPNIRFVLTSRPHDNLLDHFTGKQGRWLERLTISPEDDRVRKELREYVDGLMRRDEVAAAVSRAGHSADEFSAEALTKAEGNIGYLDALARGIDNALKHHDTEALRELLSLRGLPEDLAGLYSFFLRQIKAKVQGQSVMLEDSGGQTHYLAAWPTVYQNILGVLAVAFEPLTPLQIRDLGRVEAGLEYVIEALDWLRQFLEVADGRFRLYHATLPEFLTDPNTLTREPELYVAPANRHGRVAGHYWKTLRGHWESCDGYGLRHLVAHLRLGSRHAELFELIADRSWYHAQLARDPSSAAFITDMSQAWSEARELNRAEVSGSGRTSYIGREVCCALLISSVNSLSQELPPALLTALVKYAPDWSHHEALAAARQNPNPLRKAHSLCALLPLLPAELRSHVVEEALSATEGVVDYPWSRAEARLAIAARLPSSERREVERLALEAAIKEESEIYRTDTLAWIAGLIPRRMLPAVLDAALKLEHAHDREKVLVAISTYLPIRLLRKALRGGLANAECRPAAMTAKVRLLSKVKRTPLLLQALEEVLKLDDAHCQEMAIKCLLPYLPDASLGEAFRVVRQIYSLGNDRETALAALAERFSNAGNVERALDAVDLIATGWVKARAIESVAPHLSDAQWAKAVASARQIDPEYGNRYWKAETLGLLIHVAPPDERLAVIAEALALMEIRDDDRRAMSLVGLAPHLPVNRRREAFAAAQKIKDTFLQTEALVRIASCLPEDLLPKAYEVARHLGEDRYEARALSALALRLPEHLLESAVGDAWRFDDRHRAMLTQAIAPRLTEPLLATAIWHVESMYDLSAKLAILEALPHSNEPPLRQLFKTIMEQAQGDPSAQARVMVTAATHLPEAERPGAVDEVLAAVREVPEPVWSDHARRALAFCLASVHRYEEALRWAGRIRDDNMRAQVVESLIPSLPEQLLEFAIRISENVQQWPVQLSLLSALNARRPERNLFAPALEIAQTLAQRNDDHASEISNVLIPLLRYLPLTQRSDILARAVACAREIHSYNDRRRVLNELCKLLLENMSLASLPQIYDLWQETLQMAARAQREDVLTGLESMTPIYVALGGAAVAQEAFEAIVEVGRRWP